MATPGLSMLAFAYTILTSIINLVDSTRSYPFAMSDLSFLRSAGEDPTYYILNPNYRGNIAMNTGTNTIATVLSSLITVLSAGPAVSLYGSPIRSPTTAIA
jgi:hypothetical protein